MAILVALVFASSCGESATDPASGQAPTTGRPTGTSPSDTDTSTTTTLSRSAAAYEELRRSPLADDLSDLVRERLILQTGCGGEADDPTPLVSSLTDTRVRDAATAAFAAQTLADAACGDPDAWRAESVTAAHRFLDLEDALLAMSDRDALPAPPLAADGSDTELTSTLAAVNDRVHTALKDPPEVALTNMWLTTDHLGHTLELRRRASIGQAPEAVIIGSSLGFSLDELAVTQRLAQETFPAQLAAGPLVVQAPWLAEIRSLGVDPELVILPTSTHELFQCIPGYQFVGRAALRDMAFRRVPHLSGLARLDLLLGPAPAPSYGHSSVSRRYRELAEDGPATATGTDRFRMGVQRQRFAPTYENPDTCGLDAIEALVTAEKAAGGRVVVIAFPIHPTLAAMHPLGSAGHEAAFAELEILLESHDVELIDKRDGYSDDEFNDLTHLNVDGSARITADVLAELR